MQSILKTSQANLYLDATLTTVKLAALIDIDPTEIITVKQETTTAKNNIVVHAVDFSGLGSNNWGRTRNADGELLTFRPLAKVFHGMIKSYLFLELATVVKRSLSEIAVRQHSRSETASK